MKWLLLLVSFILLGCEGEDMVVGQEQDVVYVASNIVDDVPIYNTGTVYEDGAVVRKSDNYYYSVTRVTERAHEYGECHGLIGRASSGYAGAEIYRAAPHITNGASSYVCDFTLSPWVKREYHYTFVSLVDNIITYAEKTRDGNVAIDGTVSWGAWTATTNKTYSIASSYDDAKIGQFVSEDGWLVAIMGEKYKEVNLLTKIGASHILAPIDFQSNTVATSGIDYITYRVKALKRFNSVSIGGVKATTAKITIYRAGVEIASKDKTVDGYVDDAHIFEQVPQTVGARFDQMFEADDEIRVELWNDVEAEIGSLHTAATVKIGATDYRWEVSPKSFVTLKVDRFGYTEPSTKLARRNVTCTVYVPTEKLQQTIDMFSALLEKFAIIDLTDSMIQEIDGDQRAVRRGMIITAPTKVDGAKDQPNAAIKMTFLEAV